jgi:nitroreductase
MSVNDVILQRRTLRRFTQQPIKTDLLKQFVNGARLAPSAANLQPLEYIIVTDKTVCKEVFTTLKWAAYIKPEWKPAPSEQPPAYIVILTKKDTSFDPKRDVGLAAAYLILAAEEKNLGSCIIFNVNREKLRSILKIPEILLIDCVIALGYKAETSVVEPLKDSVVYWRDENNTLHVPKRALDDIVHINRY